MNDTSRQPRDMSEDGFPVGTTEFTKGNPAEDGWHDAALAEIADAGISFEYSKKGDHQGVMVFQLDEVVEDSDFAGQRKEALRYFSFDRGLGSSAKGTKLREVLEGWRGTPFSAAEMERMKTEKFKLAKLVGQPLMIMTVATKADKSDRALSAIAKTAPANKDKSKRLKVSDNYVPWHEREGRKQKGAADPRGNDSEASWGEDTDTGSAVEDDDAPPF